MVAQQTEDAAGRALAGRRALVTGGGRNIGRAIALTLAGAGAAVAVLGRSDRDALDETVRAIEALGGRGVAVLGDVADPVGGPAAVATAIDRLGGLDVLVNNAAVRRHVPFRDMSFEAWRAITAIILDGAFLCTKTAHGALAASGTGTVINLGGVSAHLGASERAHVIAAKMGLVGLTRALAVELAPDGICVNCVAPGQIDTTRAPGSASPRFGAGGPPVGRSGTVEDVAAMVLHLAGPTGRYITGQTLHINGGLYFG